MLGTTSLAEGLFFLFSGRCAHHAEDLPAGVYGFLHELRTKEDILHRAVGVDTRIQRILSEVLVAVGITDRNNASFLSSQSVPTL
jgi:hypothetical protein